MLIRSFEKYKGIPLKPQDYGNSHPHFHDIFLNHLTHGFGRVNLTVGIASGVVRLVPATSIMNVLKEVASSSKIFPSPLIISTCMLLGLLIVIIVDGYKPYHKSLYLFYLEGLY